MTSREVLAVLIDRLLHNYTVGQGLRKLVGSHREWYGVIPGNWVRQVKFKWPFYPGPYAEQLRNYLDQHPVKRRAILDKSIVRVFSLLKVYRQVCDCPVDVFIVTDPKDEEVLLIFFQETAPLQ